MRRASPADVTTLVLAALVPCWTVVHARCTREEIDGEVLEEWWFLEPRPDATVDLVLASHAALRRAPAGGYANREIRLS